MKKNARNPAMDIIRCLALLGVVSVHFFRNTDFYYLYITGPRMYLMTFLRSASMICVPLFIMLSGYLLNRKRPERRYFTKLWKTISIYVLASGCCYVYACFLAPEADGNGSIGEFVRQTLAFESAPYAWYINMYVGLFLLIPYLNIAFEGLSTEKERRGLILVLLIMTALPGVTNIFSLKDDILFMGNAHIPDPVLPSYWVAFYPVTYYFLGAYLNRHPLKLQRRTELLLLLGALFLNGLLNCLACWGDYFPLGPWQEHEALPNAVVAVIVFDYLAKGDYSRLTAGSCKVLAWLSDRCLGAFLVSWIFDEIFYDILNRIQPVFAYQIFFYPVMVLAVSGCSILLSAVLNNIYGMLAAVCTVKTKI